MAVRTLAVSRHIDAEPDQLYDLVSDLGQMAALSPEYVGAWRLWRGPTRPGVRFVGWNRAGSRVWPTTCHVVAADRPWEFAFDVGLLGLPVARWAYRFEAVASGGTLVGETWTDRRADDVPGALMRWASEVVVGVDVEERAARNEHGMQTTLARLAELAQPRS